MSVPRTAYLQRDVGRAIAQEVRAKLSATQQSPVRPTHAVNPAAFDDYLKGRFYFDNGYTKPDSLKKAQQYFEHSIQTDPNFAPAYAGLANTSIYSAFAGVSKRDWADGVGGYSERESMDSECANRAGTSPNTAS
jgi:hypothetical protein